jgi:hypothetical protein
MRVLSLLVLMMIAGAAWAQTAPTVDDPNSPSHAALRKVKPNIAGQHNGIFLEPEPRAFNDHAGFVSLFDGRTLDGWSGMPGIWRVEDGAIVGESTREKVAGNTFLVLQKVTAKDFDLKLEIRVENGGGSGVQYRSSTGIPPGRTAGKGEPPLDPRWVMIGPQADFWLGLTPKTKAYSGQLYSQNTSRGIIAWTGQAVQTLPGEPPRLVGTIGDRTALSGVVKEGDWNEMEVIARGGVMMHFLNGQLMAVLVDDDPASSNNVAGLFGLQVEGTPCKVSFRNLWLKKMD